MDVNFRAAEFARLSPRERVELCRQMASEASSLAENASAKVRTAYLELARQWLALAAEIEQEHARRN
jgi:hypothetical protein